MHLFGDGGECTLVGKHPSESGYFSYPGRHGRRGFWRNLDGDRRRCGIQDKPPLLVCSSRLRNTQLPP
jgi:hypothetical protein